MEQFKINQMEQEAEEMASLCYLDKKNATFERTKGGFVSLTYGGKTWERVQVIRLFPFTEPEKFHPNRGRTLQRNWDYKESQRGIQRDEKDAFRTIKSALFYTYYSKSSLHKG